ncbi:hypothetical protein Pmar_PMAR029256 [Perkinsus marinus ATCC 50983]|uniref:Uncharacterized protein n=1 Tax=Perkinsus marinus (strain ATCC 50983 / TXsc) TaxID=423536 RepID=C5KMN4_PERM5|nr:hypothetical protein Pmar_PMAR029256 [Perkinsus marinus ATCC 50983]EER14192.1 hypothetical protein Pmar_PMAR029256 [Perkinsus marinus ATCC 50983]|eukprot:XP_002782397.1 hypothetical protein Pmar_PMAR029256 [Perkinsus marinus ATCC 50983]
MTDENCVNVVPKGCDIYSRLVKGVLPPTPTEATTPHSGEDSPVSLGEEAHPLGGKRGDRFALFACRTSSNLLLIHCFNYHAHTHFTIYALWTGSAPPNCHVRCVGMSHLKASATA